MMSSEVIRLLLGLWKPKKFVEWLKDTNKELEEAVGQKAHNKEIFQEGKHKNELLPYFLQYLTIRHSLNLMRGTWVLAGATIILALATVALVIATIWIKA